MDDREIFKPTAAPEFFVGPEVVALEPEAELRALALERARTILMNSSIFAGTDTKSRTVEDFIALADYILYGPLVDAELDDNSGAS